MNFEKLTFESGQESEFKAKIEIEPSFNDFISDEFKQNPMEYFESRGQNIKSGEIKFDETGRKREDPTAVKNLPTWIDKNGQELNVIGKRVDVIKGKVGESGNPFYEYKIMKTVLSLDLPTSRPIAKVEQQGDYLIIMEKVQGIGWYEKNTLQLKEKGYTDEDISDLKVQAEAMMTKLQQQFEEAGIIRGWKLKDMILDIDIKNKKINKITPVDWERTKINIEKLDKYKKEKDIKFND